MATNASEESPCLEVLTASMMLMPTRRSRRTMCSDRKPCSRTAEESFDQLAVEYYLLADQCQVEAKFDSKKTAISAKAAFPVQAA